MYPSHDGPVVRIVDDGAFVFSKRRPPGYDKASWPESESRHRSPSGLDHSHDAGADSLGQGGLGLDNGGEWAQLPHSPW